MKKKIILVIISIVFCLPNVLNAQFSGDGNNSGGNLGPPSYKKDSKTDSLSPSRQDISLDKEPVNTGVTTTTVSTGRRVSDDDNNQTATADNNANNDNNDNENFDTGESHNNCGCGGKWGLLGLLGLLGLGGLYKRNPDNRSV